MFIVTLLFKGKYMKALIISDTEFDSDTYRRLRRIVGEHLTGRGFDMEEMPISRGSLAYCMGCFGCWIKSPGECVIDDDIARINKAVISSDAVFYLCPIVFGQYSANIKSAIDRWLPNMLPFFITRKDGSTMHPPRYESYPKQVMIGYGASSEDDKLLFTDIIKKHRSNVEALVYCRDDEELLSLLDSIELKRIGGSL
jgi:multimeric flavodoxin WrbA